MNGPPRRQPSLSLVSIYEISKILSTSLNLEATLRAVLNLLSCYMDMRRGVVAIHDETGNLTVVAASGMSPRDVSLGAADLPAEVAARILNGEMPFVTENVAEDALLADYVRVPDAMEDETVSFLAVPIKTSGKPFGVLAIARIWQSKGSVDFGEDVRFLTMVANLVAQTVKLHQRFPADSAPQRAAAGARAAVRAAPRLEGGPYRLQDIIGVSRAMQQVFAQVHLVAPSRSTVVLRGESGTGKELIARAVHQLSPRTGGPFIKVNCAALPDTLLESELFGHEKGAFTGASHDRKGRFELADGGTLFLDEIGDISPAFQAKLLRVLQEREFERLGGARTIKVDVRLVCATNRNLEEAVAKGEFRADLYYRINVVPIFIPSLRERIEDIPLLAEHFLAIFNRENERQLRFTERAIATLQGCRFPGNVRELENCIQRVATLTQGDVIDEIDLACQQELCQCTTLLPQPAFATANDPAAADDGNSSQADWQELDDLGDLDALPERERLIRVMERAGWVQAKAARLLGISPRQVGYALRKHKIELKRF
ncbi:MAG: nif-specific transcriptional activator NifA [Rhodospirillales bacterium]|jgi:Nif-specific regulatory protein|nr:nif-specific transcriptional activator NifA [Rhodospirillales bacterium]